MIILLPKATEYKIGEDFPFLTIPLGMEGAESASFEDFQWWAESSKFQNWLKANPREWVADSEDFTKYGSVEQYLRECYGYQIDDINNIDIDINESTGVVSFSEFSKLNEVEPAKASGGNDAAQREAIKFHFAYNKLRSEGKLDETLTANEIPGGSDKAIFICGEDPSTGENILETLKALRATGFGKQSTQSKIALVKISEMVPGGPIGDDETTESLTQKIVEDATILAAMGGAGVVLYGTLKYAGGAFVGRKLLKSISGFSPAARAAAEGARLIKTAETATKVAAEATKAAKTAAEIAEAARLTKIAKDATQAAEAAKLVADAEKSAKWTTRFKSGTTSTIKSLWSGAKDIALLKNTRIIGSAIGRGARGAKAAYTLGKVGVGGALKAFGKGLTRGATQGGAKAIPFVGEVLMVIDAVGSTWNWYSSKQAPRFGEVESFAHNEMDPKKIPIGLPITVCWSQPAGGGWGTAVSFLFSNETRTTAEIIKIADKGTSSIFIVTQINAKAMQAQLAEHDLVLMSLDNNDIVNDQDGVLNTLARIVDNEDLDFKISYVDGIDKIATLFNFQGMCDWSVFATALQNASDQLIVSDTSAPETYEFYYTNKDNDIVNVSGKLLTDEELRSTNPTDLQNIFYADESNEPFGRENKSEKVKESEYIGYDTILNESEVITSVSEFTDRSMGLFEDKAGSKNAPDAIKLTHEENSTPAAVAIYLVTDKEYANPDLRKYRNGLFTNFTIDPKDYGAKKDQPISVEVNTVREEIGSPKRGVYVFTKPKPKKEEEDIVVVVNPITDEDKDKDKDKDKEKDKVSDDYYIKVDPKDVQVKDRRSSTVIRDNSVVGGVNLIDKFLTDKEKEILGIQNWKAITFAKALQDNRGDVIEVKLKNRFASFGDKTRRYRITDGESFQIAKKFSGEVEDRIKYE
jgi:hypothetical protein